MALQWWTRDSGGGGSGSGDEVAMWWSWRQCGGNGACGVGGHGVVLARIMYGGGGGRKY